jgi:hypothetical protein
MISESICFLLSTVVGQKDTFLLLLKFRLPAYLSSSHPHLPYDFDTEQYSTIQVRSGPAKSVPTLFEPTQSDSAQSGLVTIGPLILQALKH